MRFNIGISGATGVTGEVTLRILEARGFPVGELRLFASRRSAGQTLRWRGQDRVEALADGNFAGLDLIISATSPGRTAPPPSRSWRWRRCTGPLAWRA